MVELLELAVLDDEDEEGAELVELEMIVVVVAVGTLELVLLGVLNEEAPLDVVVLLELEDMLEVDGDEFAVLWLVELGVLLELKVLVKVEVLVEELCAELTVREVDTPVEDDDEVSVNVLLLDAEGEVAESVDDELVVGLKVKLDAELEVVVELDELVVDPEKILEVGVDVLLLLVEGVLVDVEAADCKVEEVAELGEDEELEEVLENVGL